MQCVSLSSRMLDLRVGPGTRQAKRYAKRDPATNRPERMDSHPDPAIDQSCENLLGLRAGPRSTIELAPAGEGPGVSRV